MTNEAHPALREAEDHLRKAIATQCCEAAAESLLAYRMLLDETLRETAGGSAQAAALAAEAATLLRRLARVVRVSRAHDLKRRESVGTAREYAPGDGSRLPPRLMHV